MGRKTLYLLETAGLLVCGIAIGNIISGLLAKERVVNIRYIPTDTEIVREQIDRMQDGTCRLYVKMYGTNAVETLPGGECLLGLEAVKVYLDREILSEPLIKGQGL